MPHASAPVTIVNAAKIHDRRVELGLTLEQVAGLCGVSRQFIHKIEQGKAKGSVSLFVHLARALDCTVEELVNV